MKLAHLSSLALVGTILLVACGGETAAPASSAPPPASVAASKPAALASSPAAASPAASASAKPAASAPVSAAAAAKPSVSGQTAAITLALGYIPNIQFSPFYVAQARDFYKNEGIDISFDNGTSPD